MGRLKRVGDRSERETESKLLIILNWKLKIFHTTMVYDKYHNRIHERFNSSSNETPTRRDEVKAGNYTNLTCLGQVIIRLISVIR